MRTGATPHPSARMFRRGRDQVLPARRVLDGVSVVWNCARLRRDWRDELRRDQDERRALQSRTQWTAARWDRVRAGWSWFQGRGRSVPHVGTRRIRGGPNAYHGLYGGSGEGGCFRRVLPTLARRILESRVRVAPGGVVAGGDYYDRRKPDRAGSAEHQAAACVLEHRARGLHPRRDHRWDRARQLGVHVLSIRVHHGHARRIRGDRRTGKVRRRQHEHRGLRRIVECQARTIGSDGGLHARSARVSDLWRNWILCHMVRAASRFAIAVPSDDTGGGARNRQRDQRGVLSLRGDGDVHEATDQRDRRARGDECLDGRSGVGVRCRHSHFWLVPGRDRVIHTMQCAICKLAAHSPRCQPGSRRTRVALTGMDISREIFREYDVRGVAGKDLTEEVATAVAGAYAAFLGEKRLRGSIAVGRDNRPSGGPLHKALVGGLLASGVDVVDIGVVPTPLAYWSQHNLDVIGGIQITGSHNPPEYNGFKLGLDTSSIYGADIQHLYELAGAGKFPRGKGKLRSEEVIDGYVEDIAARTGK